MKGKRRYYVYGTGYANGCEGSDPLGANTKHGLRELTCFYGGNITAKFEFQVEARSMSHALRKAKRKTRPARRALGCRVHEWMLNEATA